MEDMIGQTIEPGEHLIDERGRLWLVLHTEPTWQRELVARAQEVRKRTLGPGRYVHLQHVLKTPERLLRASEKERAAEWHTAYEQFVRPTRKQEISTRRKEFQRRYRGRDS